MAQKKRKSIGEQEKALQERINALEEKKKHLAAIVDKRRTRRLILIGALIEKIYSEPDREKGRAYCATRAKEMYGKRPADLALVLETFEPSS